MNPNTNQTRPHSGPVPRHHSPAAGAPIRDVMAIPRRPAAAAPQQQPVDFVSRSPHAVPPIAPPQPAPQPTAQPKTVSIRLTIPRWRRLKLLPRSLRRHPRIWLLLLLLGGVLFAAGYIIGHRTAVVKHVVAQPAMLPRLLWMIRMGGGN